MGNNLNTTVIMREVQYFRQVWMLLLCLIPSAFVLYMAVQQLVFKHPMGNNPASDTVMVILAVVFGILLPVFILSTHLTTEVRQDGLYIRFFPFHVRTKKISLEDIALCEAVTYRPIRDYGGYGIRYGRKGKAYNVSGSRGIRIEYAGGKKLLIGSQDPEALLQSLQAFVQKVNTEK
ncbi:DUF6141 family protein [candidate division KSB1 bacterium]